MTYDPNGGDSGALQTVVTPGEPYGPQPGAARRGHSLAGWWTAPEGGEQVLPDTPVTREEDHTLYAHWEAQAGYTLTFDGNGGRVKSREAKTTIREGDRYGSLPTPLREGYGFEGWFTDPDGGDAVTPDSVFTGTADAVLYAHWAYDPEAFWTFTLTNRTQQVYLCQQVPIYFEREDGMTQRYVGLISDTGSVNVAENRDDPAVTDDWVLAKKPEVVIKCVDSITSAAREALESRFPAQKCVLVTSAALGDGPSGLYARLTLAKALYPDWYEDVDPGTAAAELGADTSCIRLGG